MQRKHVFSLALLGALALAPTGRAQVGVDADVSLGGGSVADADVGVSLGDGSVADADIGATVGGGSVADADVNATVGGGSVADADVNATVGGGSVADADVNATVGGGSVADADVNATVGGGSLADADVGATVGGTGTTVGADVTVGGTGTGTQPPGGTTSTQGDGPQLVGRDLIGNDGVRLGVIGQVTQNLICTRDQRCLNYTTRPVLTAEGVVVNVSSDVFLR